MVEEMRSKWCEDLEELLQCPVCFERPRGVVSQCSMGHHSCTPCKDQMRWCPICKSQYLGTRNYLAEDLCAKLDEIKLSLLDPLHHSNKKLVDKKAQVGLETQLPQASVTPVVTKRSLPSVGKGKYPCRIGNCTMRLPHGRMTSHMRYYHNTRFYESSSPNGEVYKQAWKMDYDEESMKCDLAIRVAEMGLFFLNIELDSDGDLLGFFRIVNSNFIGKQFRFKLEVGGESRSSSFSGEVHSCRVDTNDIFEDCLHVSGEDMLRMTDKDSTFKCTLTLTRLPEPTRKRSEPQRNVTNVHTP